MEIKAPLRRISFKYQLGRLREHKQRSSMMYLTDSSKSYGLKQIRGGPLSMIQWATKNRHLNSSSRRIRSRLRIGKKYFGSILEGSGCMAILGATFFPFFFFYMTLGVQPLLPYMSCAFQEGKNFFPCFQVHLMFFWVKLYS